MIAITCLAQPRQGGETCATAVQIPGIPFQDNGQTGQSDNCAGQPYRDVFYQFTAVTPGQYTAAMCGSPTNGYLKIWPQNACCTTLLYSADVGCGDDPVINFPLISGQSVIFECGSATLTPTPEPYAFQLSGPAPPACTGTAQLNSTALAFPATYVNLQSQLSFTLTNTGAGNLCVDSIRTNGYIWSISPSSFQLSPSALQLVTVTFAPTFAHEFLGTVEIFSSDAATPLDSILLEGTACLEVVTPLSPVLRDANAPNSVYFEAPFVAENPDQEYAIELVSQNEWLDYPFGTSNQAVWATAAQWGIGSAGLISGLLPSAPYAIRFQARDCTGAQLAGPITNGQSGAEIVVANPGLTLKVLNDSTLQLNWDGVCKDTSGNAVANQAWIINRSSFADSVPLPWVTLDPYDSVYTFQIASAREFFSIEPVAMNHWAGGRPFIAWPPNGARVAGWQDVILKDALHEAEWDSFRIEADSAGWNVVLGSSDPTLTNLQSDRGTYYDLTSLGTGAHTITATVLNRQGSEVSTSIAVNSVQSPYATFTATYDSTHRIFTLSEAGTVIPSGSAQTATLWRFSHVGERYGPAVTIPWSPDFDSLMIVWADPKVDHPPVYADDPPPTAPEENGGVTPKSEQAPVKWRYMRCCCRDMTLNYSAGETEPYKNGKGKRGPIVTCDAKSGYFEIGFGVEVTINYDWILSEAPGECTQGQDAKGTRTISTGTCSNQDHSCTTTSTEIRCKFKVGHPETQYCYSTTDDGFGDDGFGMAEQIGHTDGRNRGPSRDQSKLRPDIKKVRTAGKASGVSRWFDPAVESGTLAINHCIHDVAQNKFFARADPPCDSEMPCCLMWGTAWDVTLCKTEDVCFATPAPPTLDPITPPDGGCPALAP
jgi:hypothetical protein